MVDRRKILLVSNGFYPEISPRSLRATELAKEFCRQGHDVVVISKFRDHDYTNFVSEYGIKIKMWRKSFLPNIHDFKKRPFSLISRIISRTLRLLLEYPDIEDMFKIKNILRDENGYDMMISFAVPYPVHWGVAWARSKKHKIASIWIADCGDPYMGDVLDSFRKPFYFAFVEKWFCRKSDFISIPVKSAINGYYPIFHSKIKIIPQGFDFDLKEKERKHIENRTPEFAYAGAFLRGIREPGPLLKTLIKTDKPFKFYVFTNQLDLFRDYEELLERRLILSNYIDRIELLKKLSKMDFLINFDNNTKLNVPSKLIDYAITGRPVLNIDNSFKEDDLFSFLNKDYSKRMILPDPNEYHIKNVSMRFFDLILRKPLDDKEI